MSTPLEPQSRNKLNDLRAQLSRLGYGAEAGKGKAVVSADEIRRQLKRKRPKTLPSAPAPRASPIPSLVYRRDLPAGRSSPSMRRMVPAEKVILEETVAGEVVEGPSGGRMFRVCHDVGTIAGAEQLGATFGSTLQDPFSSLSQRLAERFPGETPFPERMLFMDIETTGLSSSPLFLIGIMVWSSGAFRIEQFLARHYGEERPVLRAFREACTARDFLVTFNGKSFDLPYIRARSAATGLRCRLNPLHFDLLH